MSIHADRFPTRYGFTLVELLIVVLIIALLLAVALPLYLSAVANSNKRVCRANMQTIANAVEAAKVRLGDANYEEIIETNRNSIDVTTANAGIGALIDLPSVPVCPNHGTYEVRRGNTEDFTTFKVRCRGTTDGTFQPGVNFN